MDLPAAFDDIPASGGDDRPLGIVERLAVECDDAGTEIEFGLADHGVSKISADVGGVLESLIAIVDRGFGIGGGGIRVIGFG